MAHVRHATTDYDRLLSEGMDRHEAREAVRAEVEQHLATWTSPRDRAP